MRKNILAFILVTACSAAALARGIDSPMPAQALATVAAIGGFLLVPTLLLAAFLGAPRFLAWRRRHHDHLVPATPRTYRASV